MGLCSQLYSICPLSIYKKSRIQIYNLYCYTFQYCLFYKLVCQEPANFSSAQMTLLAKLIFSVYIRHGIYNFAGAQKLLEVS